VRERLQDLGSTLTRARYPGGFWGTLIGVVFLNPLLATAAGATAGTIGGALTDVRINNDFMKNIASGFSNGTSALFVLVRNVTPDKVLAELEGSGDKGPTDVTQPRGRDEAAGGTGCRKANRFRLIAEN